MEKWHGHPTGMHRIWLVSYLLQNRYKHEAEDCSEKETQSLHCRVLVDKDRAGWSLQPQGWGSWGSQIFPKPRGGNSQMDHYCRMASLPGWTCWMSLDKQHLGKQINYLIVNTHFQPGKLALSGASDPSSSALLASSGDKMGHAAHRKNCSIFVSFSAIYSNV